jgi:hypothetical protein
LNEIACWNYALVGNLEPEINLKRYDNIIGKISRKKNFEYDNMIEFEGMISGWENEVQGASKATINDLNLKASLVKNKIQKFEWKQFNDNEANYFNKKNWIIFLIPLLYFISFSISNPIMFPWYISQMEPFWLLISFLGIYHLYKNNYSKYYSIFIVLILCISFLSFVNRVTNPDMGSKNHLFSAGQYLKDRIQPNDSIGISNIGIVAFETKAKIVDFFGLVKEDAFLYYPIKNGCFDKNELYVIPPDLIKASTPEWLVFGDNEMDDCFKNSLWFNKNYTQKFRTGDFYIYKIKKDVR